MRRILMPIALALFFLILGWAAQAFQPPPSSTVPENGLAKYMYPETKPEYRKPAYQNRDCLAEMVEPKQDYALEEEVPEPTIKEPQVKPGTAFLPDKPDKVKSDTEVFCKDSIHFLLVGRPWKAKILDIIMMVTLNPDGGAILTAIDRDYPVVYNGSKIPLGRLLAEGGGYAKLSSFAAEITGLRPSFYIDLNSRGFMEMLSQIGGIDRALYASLDRSAPVVMTGAKNLCGAALLKILTDPDISTAEKERLIIALLLTTRKIHNTSRELALLWTGYRNIKTDLSLSDLLKIRGVALEICPTQIRLREIGYP